MEVYIYIRIQHGETHKTLFEKGGGREGRNGNIMYGRNFFRVHCIYVWYYHNEISY
jgi:hypothetical protein